MHDDLGHALSLVALNLGRLELDGTLPVSARRTVEAARETLTGAVGRLGDSVRTLRNGQVPGLAAPEPADVVALVASARSAGAEVILNGGLPPDADATSVARVVREGLTNATKHAPRAPVVVTLAPGEGGSTRVLITNPVDRGTDDGGAVPSGNGAGSGLRVLADELAARGGGLVAGTSGRVFRLEAVAPRAALSAEGPPQPPQPAVEARRRTLLIAAGLVGCVVVVLGGLEVFARSEARRAMLPASDYARLVEGMPRAQAEDLLPSHEILPAPTSPAGTDCHDYTVSTDWLADSSGDVYRVCFTADRVSSTAVLAHQEQ